MTKQQRDDRAPIQIAAEHIKRAISDHTSIKAPLGQNVRRNSRNGRNLGILIGAVIVFGALINTGIHKLTGSSWKTVSCVQFMHDSASQQQSLVNALQSTWKYDRYSPYANYQTMDGQTHSGVAPATIMSIENACYDTPAGPTGTTLLNVVQNTNNS